MKIVLINARYYPDIHGGGDKSTQVLAEGLVSAGFDVSVIATSKQNIIEEYYHNNVKVKKIPLHNLYWFPPEKPQHKLKKALWHLIDIYNPFMEYSVRNVLKNEKPDLIHTQALDGFSVSVWNAAKKLSIPVAHTLRGYKLLCPKATMFKNGRNCVKQCKSCSAYSFFQRPLSNKIDAVIGISDFVLNKHLQYRFFENAPIKAQIFNAYQPDSIIKIKDEKKKDKLKLGYFGRIHKTKGIESIVSALMNLSEESYEFIIGGDGDAAYISELKRKLNKKPVKFLGQVKPDDYFPSIDILLALSQWNEPLGRVVLESFSFGIPVIGSDRGGIPEMIDDGKNGFVVDPDDTEAISEILLNLMNSKNLFELKKYALQSSSSFLPEKIIKDHLDVYSKVIGKDLR